MDRHGGGDAEHRRLPVQFPPARFHPGLALRVRRRRVRRHGAAAECRAGRRRAGRSNAAPMTTGSGTPVTGTSVATPPPLALPPRPRILVVALRRLGDVLFATPLIASLRRAYPAARIEALVFADTAGMLAGNPDLDRVVAMPSARGAVSEPRARAAPVQALRPRGLDPERRSPDVLRASRGPPPRRPDRRRPARRVAASRAHPRGAEPARTAPARGDASPRRCDRGRTRAAPRLSARRGAAQLRRRRLRGHPCGAELHL